MTFAPEHMYARRAWGSLGYIREGVSPAQYTRQTIYRLRAKAWPKSTLRAEHRGALSSRWRRTGLEELFGGSDRPGLTKKNVRRNLFWESRRRRVLGELS